MVYNIIYLKYSHFYFILRRGFQACMIELLSRDLKGYADWRLVQAKKTMLAPSLNIL